MQCIIFVCFTQVYNIKAMLLKPNWISSKVECCVSDLTELLVVGKGFIFIACRHLHKYSSHITKTILEESQHSTQTIKIFKKCIYQNHILFLPPPHRPLNQLDTNPC